LRSFLSNNCSAKIIFISGIKKEIFDTTKTADELFKEFKDIYKKDQQILGFISFGKGSVVGNIEAIAEAFEKIQSSFEDLKNVQYIGASYEGAKIFCNKYSTYKVLDELNIPVPKTIELVYDIHSKKNSKLFSTLNFPLVLKAEDLSGGRGIKYINSLEILKTSLNNLYGLGINKVILSDYLKGIEATFTVFRLGDNFLRLPTSYKADTSTEMIHPDAKVKISGIFTEFNEYFEYVESLMKKYNIYGFFSLQGILTKNNNQYFVKFLEAAPRFTGSTPIMEASLVNFNIFEMLAKWFIDGEIFFGYERRPAIQYSTYIHNHFDTINKLKEKQWIIEAKYEDLSTLQYSEDESKRIRISFYLNNLNELNEKADLIADMCGNKTYRSEINNIFKIFEIEHPLIFENYTKKVLEGNWGSDTIWEFYLSSYLPSKELCSAVFGFPKNGQKFVLTKTERGWEIPGGHIEERENIKDALYREILEEAGLVVNYAMLFGYRKIISNKPLFNKEGKQYPFPISYIPHFIVSFSKDLKKYSGKEVLDRKIFNNNEIVLLDSHVKNIIEIAIANTDRLAS
jgi:hypothetical protein